MNKTTMCPIPWNHISVQQNGDFRMCCQQIYEPYGKISTNGIISNIKNTEINEVRNSDIYKEVRKSMINGEKHSLCRLCYKDESLGMWSKRLHMIDVYGDDFIKDTNTDGTIDIDKSPVKYFDIRFGNLCNLKCRYCGPTDSSLWYEDFVKTNSDKMHYYGTTEYKIIQINNKWTVDSDDFEWYNNPVFWEQITRMIPVMDRYYFTGGEPTINKTHYSLLELIIKSGYSKQVILEYNSNMVAIPDKLYEYWKEFKGVDVGCSIDGIGDMANYLRPPSKWESLEENINKFGYNTTPSINGALSTTVSVYNILHFLDLSKWLLTKNYPRIRSTPSFHMLEGPNYMNAQVLPIATKELIKQEYEKFYEYIEQYYSKELTDIIKIRYNTIIAHMFSRSSESLLFKLKIETAKLDAIRGHDLSKEVPWLHEVLSKY